MQKAILGKKAGMTQIWDANDCALPVTIIDVSPCRVVRLKTQEVDGYSSIQVTTGEVNPKRLTKPALGHFEKAGVEPGSQLLEFRLDDTSAYEVGQEITLDIFAEGDMVDVTSISKGKGFAGVIKRYGFAGSPASHGAHKVHRKPGSVGQCATPSRIFKGKKMPGRMGHEKVTIQNLELVGVDLQEQTLMVKGSVPGSRGSSVLIRNAVKIPVQMAEAK